MTTDAATRHDSAQQPSPRRASLPLVTGEWVEVRSAQEILATLDRDGCLDGMPFMPEMRQFCGQTIRVFKRAHKTCDTIYQSGARALDHSVHLDALRCDGSAHGGCQAQCMLFWKEAWLKRRGVPSAQAAQAGPGCSPSQLERATRADSEPGAEPRYRCQATQLLSASKPLRPWDLRQYVQDYRSGNVDGATFMRGGAYRLSAYLIRRTAWLGQRLPCGGKLSQTLMQLYDLTQRRLREGVPYPRRSGTIPKGQRTPLGDDPRLFRPGSLVRVKSYTEILATLDTDNKNRGLYFDAENVPYCGKELRVQALVEQIIDERTGRMIHFKTPVIILEGAYCRGTYSDKRMFCPRAIYPYWRPAWLNLLEAARQQPIERIDSVETMERAQTAPASVPEPLVAARAMASSDSSGEPAGAAQR